MTYEARKSTPTDLGSCRKVRECKSVAKTVCMKQQTFRKSDIIGKRIIIYTWQAKEIKCNKQKCQKIYITNSKGRSSIRQKKASFINSFLYKIWMNFGIQKQNISKLLKVHQVLARFSDSNQINYVEPNNKYSLLIWRVLEVLNQIPKQQKIKVAMVDLICTRISFFLISCTRISLRYKMLTGLK